MGIYNFFNKDILIMEIKYVKNVIRLAKAAMGVLIYATLAW
jgi:hypothetical protein